MVNTHDKPENLRHSLVLKIKSCFNRLLQIFNNFYSFLYPGKLMTPIHAKVLPINIQPKKKLETLLFNNDGLTLTWSSPVCAWKERVDKKVWWWWC